MGTALCKPRPLWGPSAPTLAKVWVLHRDVAQGLRVPLLPLLGITVCVCGGGGMLMVVVVTGGISPINPYRARQAKAECW